MLAGYKAQGIAKYHPKSALREQTYILYRDKAKR